MIQIPITVATMPEVQGTSIGANIASLAIPGWEKVWEKAWELGNRNPHPAGKIVKMLF